MTPRNIYRSNVTFLATIVFVLTLLAACTQEPGEESKKMIAQTVKVSEVQLPNATTKQQFPAQVSAVKTIDLSFEVTGRLQSQNLQAGNNVKRGELLATIDPTPFLRNVAESQARFKQATKDLERITSTHSKGLSPQSQLDEAKTNFELADVALKSAKQELAYTKLYAPFDAQISQRLIENDSYVQAGDVVAHLQDVSRYQVSVNIPERSMAGFKKEQLQSARAEILSLPKQTFPLKYVEHSTQADPITQSFTIVFEMDANQDLGIFPGSRASVHLASNTKADLEGVKVPFTALLGEKNSGFHIWKFNNNTSTVERAQVQVLKLIDNFALVSGDVQRGDMVVSAGVSKISEGQSVRPYQPE
jgi:RND family efflux transporter MFP subunit